MGLFVTAYNGEVNMTSKHQRGIANFSALKTSIANGEVESVKKLLGEGPLLDIEKSYLIDLAKLNYNDAIIKLLEAMPVREN